MANDPRVAQVERDEVIHNAVATSPGTTVPSSDGQFVNEALSRIGANVYAPYHQDGVDDQQPDVDIAILDSGITPYADLNVAGGYNCTSSNRSAWQDAYDHGTAVAAAAAAIDNEIGIVGVAPGARVWAVKVISDTNTTSKAIVICGLDWVAAQRDPQNSTKPLIEVANMSLNAGTKTTNVEDNNCGYTDGDTIHQAICRVTSGGTMVAAAAGNSSANAGRRIPPGYKEVVAVAAMADFDGLPGGLGSQANVCPTAAAEAGDDVFASFSNFGAVIDFVVPGKCLYLPSPSGVYARRSGTSFAAPVMAGALALHRADNPNATPAQVRQAFVNAGSYDWNFPTSPDGLKHRLLNMAGMQTQAPAPTFAITFNRNPLLVRATGGTYKVALGAQPEAGHVAPITFSHAGSPSGFVTTIAGSTMTVKSPAGLIAGESHTINVSATDGTHTVTRALTVTVDGVAPTVSLANIGFALNQPTGASTAPITASVNATDNQTVSPKLRLQRSINGGAWSNVVLNAGVGAPVNVVFGAQVRFRARATDEAGNTSAWVGSGKLRLTMIDSASSVARYSGSWSKATNKAALGSSLSSASSTSSSVSLAFTGLAAAVVAVAGPDQGAMSVTWAGQASQVTGVAPATRVDRYIVAGRSWSANGSRSVSLRPAGGTPSLVEFDALLVLRRI